MSSSYITIHVEDGPSKTTKTAFVVVSSTAPQKSEREQYLTICAVVVKSILAISELPQQYGLAPGSIPGERNSSFWTFGVILFLEAGVVLDLFFGPADFQRLGDLIGSILPNVRKKTSSR